MHAHTHIHTYIHTYIHTHTNFHMHLPSIIIVKCKNMTVIDVNRTRTFISEHITEQVKSVSIFVISRSAEKKQRMK